MRRPLLAQAPLLAAYAAIALLLIQTVSSSVADNNSTLSEAAADGNSTLSLDGNSTTVVLEAEDSNVNASMPAVPIKACDIPFWFNNTWQHQCKPYTSDGSEQWCSTTKNFTADEDWKMCHHNDLNRFKCKIPFEYQGKNYTKCLPIPISVDGGSKWWCSLVPKLDEWKKDSPDWAFCEAEGATSLNYLSLTSSSSTSSGSAGNVSAVSANGAGSSDTGMQASDSGSGGSSAEKYTSITSSSPTVVLIVGAVCAVLAVLAVLAAFGVRRRRRNRRGTALLPDDTEMGSYGGVESN